MARSVSRAPTKARRSSSAVNPRAQRAWFLHCQSGILSVAAMAPCAPRSAQRPRADELAQATRALGDEGMGRRRLHPPQIEQAFLQVARRERIHELPWLHFGRPADEGDDLVLVHRVGATVRERDLSDLVVEVHGVLAHQLDDLGRRTFRERDAMAHGHGAHRLRQLVAFERRAVDDGRLAVLRGGLVQPGVLGELLGLQRQHRGGARRFQVGDQGLGVGLLELFGVTHRDEAQRTRERHGVACRHDVGPRGRLPVELVGIERKVAERGQAGAQPLHDRRALERVLADHKVDGQQGFLFLGRWHACILAQRDDVDGVGGQFA